jgi:hypothetical protein
VVKILSLKHRGPVWGFSVTSGSILYLHMQFTLVVFHDCSFLNAEDIISFLYVVSKLELHCTSKFVFTFFRSLNCLINSLKLKKMVYVVTTELWKVKGSSFHKTLRFVSCSMDVTLLFLFSYISSH